MSLCGALCYARDYFLRAALKKEQLTKTHKVPTRYKHFAIYFNTAPSIQIQLDLTVAPGKSCTHTKFFCLCFPSLNSDSFTEERTLQYTHRRGLYLHYTIN